MLAMCDVYMLDADCQSVVITSGCLCSTVDADPSTEEAR